MWQCLVSLFGRQTVISWVVNYKEKHSYIFWWNSQWNQDGMPREPYISLFYVIPKIRRIVNLSPPSLPVKICMETQNRFTFIKILLLNILFIKSSTSWDIALCSPLIVNRRFRGTCLLHLHGRRISQAKNQHEVCSKQLHAGFLLGLFFDPENGGDVFLRNVGWLSKGYTAFYPRRKNSS
jgi:hypothetical protein